MVIYIKNLWVIESCELATQTSKEYSVYNPKTEKVLFEDDDMQKCVEFAKSKNKCKCGGRMKWTKKLDEIHISGKEGRTLCNKPMLGNNYANNDEYKKIDQTLGKQRKECEECLNEQFKRNVDENLGLDRVGNKEEERCDKCKCDVTNKHSTIEGLCDDCQDEESEHIVKIPIYDIIEVTIKGNFKDNDEIIKKAIEKAIEEFPKVAWQVDGDGIIEIDGKEVV